MAKPSRTPKEVLVEERRAEVAAQEAERAAPADVVADVRAEMEKPANRGLAGAARAAKRRSLIEARVPDPAAVNAADRAVQAREAAEAARQAREANEAEWEAFRASRRAQAAARTAEHVLATYVDVLGRAEGLRRFEILDPPAAADAVEAHFDAQARAEWESGGADALIAFLGPEI